MKTFKHHEIIKKIFCNFYSLFKLIPIEISIKLDVPYSILLHKSL